MKKMEMNLLSFVSVNISHGNIAVINTLLHTTQNLRSLGNIIISRNEI